MAFKDHYATLGVAPTATRAEIRRAYRLLARKYHPDVSTLPEAEARFKEVAEAHEALIDPERRAAHDALAREHAAGPSFTSPPGRGGGFRAGGGADDRPRWRQDEAGAAPDAGDFFESIFGRGGGPSADGNRWGATHGPWPGQDHNARIDIDLLDAFRGAQRTIALRMPSIDADGRTTMRLRHLEVRVPPGVRQGQRLRLAGQGAEGQEGGPAGDLYLEVRILPHPIYRLDGADIAFDLSVAPWEAALGATVIAATPGGDLQLTVPPGSSSGRRLRMKGKGLPGAVPGDLYAVLAVVLPPAATAPERDAYDAFAKAFARFDPRTSLTGAPAG